MKFEKKKTSEKTESYRLIDLAKILFKLKIIPGKLILKELLRRTG